MRKGLAILFLVGVSRAFAGEALGATIEVFGADIVLPPECRIPVRASLQSNNITFICSTLLSPTATHLYLEASSVCEEELLNEKAVLIQRRKLPNLEHAILKVQVSAPVSFLIHQIAWDENVCLFGISNESDVLDQIYRQIWK